MTREAATISRDHVVQERPTNAICQHYWVIDMARDAVSDGICQLCGAHKEFKNYLPDCLAGMDKEKYGEWLARHSSAKRGKGPKWDILTDTGQGE